MFHFNHPFTMCIAGCTGSGKSKWVKRLIENNKEMIDPNVTRIIYAYGVLTSDILALKQINDVILVNGFPTEEMLREYKDSLLVLDDLMSDLHKNKDFINSLFTRLSHHYRISVVFITQSVFHKDMPLLKANSHYLVLLRNPSAKIQIRTIASQMFPGSAAYFIEAYEDATMNPYGYLVVDSHPNSNNEERVLTKVFPNEHLIFYLTI